MQLMHACFKQLLPTDHTHIHTHTQGQRWVESFFLGQLVALIKPLAPASGAGGGGGGRAGVSPSAIPVPLPSPPLAIDTAAEASAPSPDPVVQVWGSMNTMCRLHSSCPPAG